MNTLVNILIGLHILQAFLFTFTILYSRYPRAVASKSRWEDGLTVISSIAIALILLDWTGAITL